jgi:hypothetical protein
MRIAWGMVQSAKKHSVCFMYLTLRSLSYALCNYFAYALHL